MCVCVCVCSKQIEPMEIEPVVAMAQHTGDPANRPKRYVAYACMTDLLLCLSPARPVSACARACPYDKLKSVHVCVCVYVRVHRAPRPTHRSQEIFGL